MSGRGLGTKEMALAMARIVSEMAGKHDFTLTERLTAYNYLLLEAICEMQLTQERIDKAVEAFRSSLQMALDEQKNPGG